MKKRLRNKILKEVLGVRKLKINKGECLVVEVNKNMEDVQLKDLKIVLESTLNCKVIISKNKIDLTVIADE